MEQPSTTAAVEEIMKSFAERTGLSPASRAPRRYLWTDAFGVCNFLELFRRTGDPEHGNLAISLVDQVHGVLGRHREDDPRTGWISGLGEQEGRLHPTVGGLRIGKKWMERRPDEPFDSRLEWDRDGQYYHYLTKWMHALNRVSRVTGDGTCNSWAVELARAAHAGFTHELAPGETKGMYWKMSIDLSRPLVASMGHLDPLDGFITYLQLQVTAAESSQGSPHPDLSGEIVEMAAICQGRQWATDDPLGIGGLLCAAYKAAQLIEKNAFEGADLVHSLLGASRLGLSSFMGTKALELPADYRLAFRELGLAIGLHAVERLQALMKKKSKLFGASEQLHRQTQSLMADAGLAERIERFWLDPTNRRAISWTEHLDINSVMLATSLAPDGYLAL
jgi:hypothetical protein